MRRPLWRVAAAERSMEPGGWWLECDNQAPERRIAVSSAWFLPPDVVRSAADGKMVSGLSALDRYGLHADVPWPLRREAGLPAPSSRSPG